MNYLLFAFALCAWFTPIASGQGGFFGVLNASSKTRIGSFEGSFAGTNILGQFLAGDSLNSLSPVGIPLPHQNGGVAGGRVTVPWIDGGNPAWVQLVAWDRSVWGEALEGVPSDQLGRTDIVSVNLFYSFQPVAAPPFSQGAIVPVPEPIPLALGVIGACVFGLASWRPWLKSHRGFLEP